MANPLALLGHWTTYPLPLAALAIVCRGGSTGCALYGSHTPGDPGGLPIFANPGPVGPVPLLYYSPHLTCKFFVLSRPCDLGVFCGEYRDAISSSLQLVLTCAIARHRNRGVVVVPGMFERRSFQ